MTQNPGLDRTKEKLVELGDPRLTRKDEGAMWLATTPFLITICAHKPKLLFFFLASHLTTVKA